MRLTEESGFVIYYDLESNLQNIFYLYSWNSRVIENDGFFFF